MPPMLWVLTVTLLKAGYVVLVAVPHIEDAENLERRMGPLDEKSALRVLIYNPDDVSRAREIGSMKADAFPAHHFPSIPSVVTRHSHLTLLGAKHPGEW